MMSIALSPSEAAMLSDAVYAGLQSENLNEFRQLSVGRVPHGFTPTGKLIRARTGTSRLSNFAIVMERELAGGNHKAVTIRGTEFSSGQDWLTNFNIGLKLGPNSWPCHSGFCTTYRSMIEEICAEVGAAPRVVHVCGHSLGGALATLTALHLHQLGHDAHLYTFGAPRVGPLGFTQDVSRKLQGKIHRVYDRGDPVAMIPLFPFLHAPLFDNGYLVGADRDSISAAHHDMQQNYLAIAKAATGWRSLISTADDGRLKFGPAYWLERAGEATRIPGGAIGLWALGRALEAILAALGSVVQTAVSGIVTTLDLLAYLLTRAIEFGGQIKDWVLDWLRTAMRWLGMQVAGAAAEVSRAFLRHVLGLLVRHLASTARRALEMVRGRSV
jgi:triacylglycerol lipase